MMLNLVCNDCGHVQSVQSITFCVKKVAAESTTNLQEIQFADLYLRSSDPGLRDISIITHKWIKKVSFGFTTQMLAKAIVQDMATLLRIRLYSNLGPSNAFCRTIF